MFSKGKLFSNLAIVAPIFALAVWLYGQPSRSPEPDRVVVGAATPAENRGNLRAWVLSAPDHRFGGLSALAMDGAHLVALTDSGVTVRFAPPEEAGPVRFVLRDLPDGPGPAVYKVARDSESLLADPSGRGWWVGFEQRHSLWLYDRRFGQAIDMRDLDVPWAPNRGAEALMAGKSVIALPEGGGAAAGGRFVAPPGVTDATRLRDGRLVLLVRRWRWTGFDNQLWIVPGAGKPARRIALDLGRLDNMEGIAAAPLADGGTRLWIVSDDNFRRWMRTLLVSLDLPPGV